MQFIFIYLLKNSLPFSIILPPKGETVKSLAERAINALACRAGIGRGLTARIERMALHIVFMALVADRWVMILRAAQGIARELKGV
jgi:hypothetical protein